MFTKRYFEALTPGICKCVLVESWVFADLIKLSEVIRVGLNPRQLAFLLGREKGRQIHRDRDWSDIAVRQTTQNCQQTTRT